MRSTTLRRGLGAVAGLTGLALGLLSDGAAAQATFELNIGSLAPKGTPWMIMLERAEAMIEKESGGRINVILRPAGIMGEVEMVRETRKGERLQGCGVTTAAIAEGGNAPQLSLIELPYLFDSDAEADAVLDNHLFAPVSDLLGKRGFVLLMWSENGWRSFATKGTPVKSPDDLKKFKMRSQESAVHLAMYKAYGVQAVQKPMTEVLTSLQSNVIDGLDNTALYLQSGGLADAVDYFTLSKHIYQPAAIVYSRSWFSKLPADLQEIVLKPKSLTAEGRAAIRAEEKEMLTNMSVYDVQVVELTPQERQAFATPARAMHQSFAATIEGGPEFFATLQGALNSVR